MKLATVALGFLQPAFALLLSIAAAVPALAEGQKHALLVGVGNYPNLPGATLEGPPHDLAALQRMLAESWGFPAGNVTVLQDGAATKAAILAALDRLATTSQPGDFVFFYFSGHGTSGFDRQFRDAGMDGSSGAILPADFKAGVPEALKEGLILGSRDLQPRLLRLEKDRQVFVVFDSCFSGNAARSFFAGGRPRYVAPRELVNPDARSRAAQLFADDEAPAAAVAATPDKPYPYRNLLYISAASKSERAMDIDQNLLRSGRVRTLDGQPHGALTSALLDGLSGAADTNHDRTITYGELYQYAKDTVSQAFPHQPQLLVADAGRDAFLATPVLGAEAGTRPVSFVMKSARQSGSRSLRVQTDGVAAELLQRIGAVAGVTAVTSGAYDLLVVQRPQGIQLVHGSGDEIGSFEPDDADAVVDRILRQVGVGQLVDLAYPDQAFGASIEVPGNRGFVREGEPFSIQIAADRDSYFLVLEVDSEGMVSVLYPGSAAEARPLRRARIPASPDTLEAGPPFGTAYLKLLAFAEKPAGFDRWISRSFAPTGRELQDLLGMLASAKGPKAQSRLKLVSQAR